MEKKKSDLLIFDVFLSYQYMHLYMFMNSFAVLFSV